MTAPIQAARSLPDVIARIQTALEAGPTDGPWYVYEAEGDATAHGISAEEGEAVSWWSEEREEGVTKIENARYIAACNPGNIRVLLSAISAKEAEVGRLREALKELRAVVPYFWDDDSSHIGELDAACGKADEALK